MFKPNTGNKNLHEINNDNRVSLVTFARPKNISVKSTTFLPNHTHSIVSLLMM
jgi:hypothetical protein